MVFESIVVDLVNRYLGDFIENLDTSQLKIGIWGGDIVLKDLYVKQSALADLNLPVNISYGNLGVLTLKIPWKNIYNEPTVATLEGLYIIAVPKADSEYNEEKEEKMEWEAKVKELLKMDESAKLKAEVDQPKAPQADSFAEKLAANVIKNLQVHVTDIHLRYEDRFTNPASPFSIGVTLRELVFQTTDENWLPTVIKGAASMIYKVVKLDSLSLYWNHQSPMLLQNDRGSIQNSLTKDIASTSNVVKYQYLIEPISSSAQLRLNLKPEEADFSLPKILLSVIFEEIAIALSKRQFTDIMELLQSMERINLASKFHKYTRPAVPRIGNASRWWHFAYKCILGESVVRRRRMWSWSRIVEHRRLSRQYKTAYVKKLRAGKKVPADLLTMLEKCEKTLNIFNIVLVRKQAELENKLKPPPQASGWFGSWFSGGDKRSPDDDDKSHIGDDIQRLMSGDEKAKLYEALGYEENSVDPTLPVEFEAVQLNIQLQRLSLTLTEQVGQSKRMQLLELRLDKMSAAIRQRPSANAIRLETEIRSLTVFGAEVGAGGEAPTMVSSSQKTGEDSLLRASLETNPLDKLCDQRLALTANSLTIVYNAPTVNHLAQFFKPPEWVHLKQLQATAMMKFEELKEQTATGLQHAIEQRKYSDISVNLQPSHLIIPETGVYTSGVSILVVDLGELVVSSAQPEKMIASPTKATDQVLNYSELSEKAYDIFEIKLRSVQVLYVPPMEDFRAVSASRVTEMHVLQPMALNIQIHKCMIQDINLAGMKVRGELPELNISISDRRLELILQLVRSIPLPPSDAPSPQTLAEEASATDLPVGEQDKNLAWKMSASEGKGMEKAPPAGQIGVKKSEQVNPTSLDLNFVVKQICLNLMQRKDDRDLPLLKLVVDKLGANVKMRTFDLVVEAFLGGIYLQHLQFKALRDEPIVNLINSPLVTETSNLLTVEYLKADRRGAAFATAYANTEQTIAVRFTELEVLLHEEAILSLLEFAAGLQAALAVDEPPPPPGGATDVAATEAAGRNVTAAAAAVAAASTATTLGQRSTGRAKKGAEIIDLALSAKLDVISLGVCTSKRMVTEIKIKGIEVDLSLQKSKTSIIAGLQDVAVFDPTPNALYPTILAFEHDVLRARVTVYNGATHGDGYADMQCVDTDLELNTGCMKVIFLNKFVADVLTFLDNFQAAKDRISEASSAVAESAVQAAQSLQTTAARIRLRVELKAPVIIVPQSSTSTNALVVDLGHISISNRFRIGAGDTRRGVPAVLEDMSVELTALKLARALMLGTEMRAECILLDPVSLKLSVTRNLAASWHHSQPDLDVSGKLQHFGVTLSQGDFRMIMSILEENLKEGEKVTDPTEAKVKCQEIAQTESVKTSPVIAATEGTVAVKAEKTEDEEEEKKKVEPYAKIVFKLSIDSLQAVLYTGNSNLTTGVSEREAACALARFQLTKISLRGTVQSDTAVRAAVSLGNCRLDDLRPGSAASITRMLEKLSIDESVATKQMIDISFTQNATQDKLVTMGLHDLHICVCIDYLMALGDFFTKGMPTPKVSKPDPKAKPLNQAPSTPIEGSLSVHFVMDHPQVVLVEDAMNVDTNALILKMDVEVKMMISSEIQTMMGNIRQLQLFSSLYRLRDSTGNVILDPLDVAFHSSAPNGHGHHMEAIFGSSVVMTISPATIRILTATLSSLSATKQSEEEVEPVSLADLWAVRTISDCNFWFLKSDIVEEVAENMEDMAKEVDIAGNVESRGEQLIVSPMKVVVRLESGEGDRTVPLLITEIGFHADVRDWSTKLNATCELSMEVAYYNESVAVWEPLMDPIEDGNSHRPWELSVEVTQNDLLALPSEYDDTDSPLVPQPKMTISTTSKDVLQLTISKTGIEVLTNIAQAFTNAYKLLPQDEVDAVAHSAYLLKNHSGHVVTVKLDKSFKVPPAAEAGCVTLLPDDEMPLSETEEREVSLKQVSIIRSTQADHMKTFVLSIPEFGATRELTIVKTEKKAFGLNQKSYPQSVWQLVCEMQSHYGSKVITFRSILQVRSRLPFAMELYYRLADDALGRCGTVPAQGTCDVPLDAAYATPPQVFFKPNDTRYQQSRSGFHWRDPPSGSSSVIVCDPTAKNLLPLYFNVQIETEKVLFESTGEKSCTLYTLHLHPCVVLHNTLPLPIICILEGSEDVIEIEAGAKKDLFNVRVGHTVVEVLLTYRGVQWSARQTILDRPDALSVWTFESSDSELPSMDLGIYFKAGDGSQELSLYCPYWMINKTGKTLAYKNADDPMVIHPSDFSDIVLFTFKAKSLIGKKKVSLKVDDSDWSDKFSLDTVGSAGTTSCKYRSYAFESATLTSPLMSFANLHVALASAAPNAPVRFESADEAPLYMKVGIGISLSNSGLTKIVSFTPFYMIINQSQAILMCKEIPDEASWITVPPNECIGFWPIQSGKKLQMTAKYSDSALVTRPFYFTEAHNTLLKVDDKNGGLNVECQPMESSIHVVLQSYQAGLATVRLVNHTSKAVVEFTQRGCKESAGQLGPGETVLYTWQCPLEKRELLWSCGEQREQKEDVVKDGAGDFFYNSDTKLFWVSFLDGMQRVLLFTEDLVVAITAQQAGELERLEQEVNLDLHGVGLSLVNNQIQKEIAYMGITSSGVIWEEKKRKRYKALKLKQSSALEKAFETYTNALLVGSAPAGIVQLDSKTEVDFGSDPMRMLKPRHCEIRRSCENGISVQYRTSPHQTQLHVKIHRLQLDNQLPGAVFSTVLAPIPPPKSVAADSVPKPFTEMSVMIRKKDFSSVMQFKYCKVLIQEMAVKVDQGFLMALMELFASGDVSAARQVALFEADCALAETSLCDDAAQSSANEQKHFYDLLHFSPLKIHLSFSLYGGSGQDKKPQVMQANVVDVFLQSVGIVLTDIQDVVFKLGYFERNYNFYNQSQLNREFIAHYSQQAIKQMYVLVLGLDVIGNPFGVIRGLAEGIEDLFYEPYQGAVQGPEEFAEGLALGVRSLLGHAVGGAAGAVSRITSALGKGIATLTLDDEYQKKRREQLNKKPADLKEGMARGGKRLVMGVFDGVTGIVRKPVEGAKKDGVEGFFKGVGKGLVGVITRPASGVVDFASISFEGIRRVADMSGEVSRLRPPRFLHPDGIVRPFIYREAEGYDTLKDVEKGKYIETDSYIAHVIVSRDLKNALLITDKRVIFASKGEIFGQWNCDWQYTWEELKEPPTAGPKGVQMLLKEKQKKSLFKSSAVGKLVPIEDAATAQWIVQKMKQAMANVK